MTTSNGHANLKSLLMVAIVLELPFSLRADEQLKNTDFTDGRAHWEGDGTAAGDAAGDANANADPLAPPPATPPAAPVGLLVKLSARDWCQVKQDFRPLIDHGTLTITYKLSDGLTLSDDDDDYGNIPQKLDLTNYLPFSVPKGNWVVTFQEPSTTELKYYVVSPKVGTDPQTYTVRINGLIIRNDKILCLAFPPGKGTVTLLHISFSDQ